MRRAITLKPAIFLLFAASPLYAQSPTDATAIPVEKFAQLPAMMDAELSPDGTHLAYIRPYKGRKVLIIQVLSGQGRPTVVPPGEEMEID